jgi:predicted permease
MNVPGNLEQEFGGQYRVVRELGRGAFGAVYLARDRALHRLVAIKVLHHARSGDPIERERFLREARTAAQLDHPGIVPLIGIGETARLTWMVMPFASGESLGARLAREGAMGVADVRVVLSQIAAALDYAHRRGVVHRDLKPENVLIDRPEIDDAPGALTLRARLVDFGIAAFPRRDPGVAPRREQWGTPSFMSPEQALGEVDLDGRSDIYSLGVLGYVMLTGELPFTGTTTTERLRQQQAGPRVQLREAAPHAPADLVSAIERCLAFDPADRWERASEVRAALAVRAPGPGKPAPLASLSSALRRRRRRGSRDRRQIPEDRTPRLGAFITGLVEEIRFATRSLARSPGFVLAAVITLALGIGANATIFGVVDRLLLRPPPHIDDPDRLIKLGVTWQNDGRDVRQGSFAYPVFKALRDRGSLFDDVAAMSIEVTAPLGRGTDARDLRALLVSASYFPLLGIVPARGRFILPDEDVEPLGVPVAVISHRLWRLQYGGDSAILGRTMDLGARRYTVVGVAPEGFTGIDVGAIDVWLPITAAEGLRFPGPDWASDAGSTWIYVIVRPRQDVSVDEALARMTPVFLAAGAQFYASLDARLFGESLTAARAARLGADARVTVLLAGVAGFVLLIACANVANLLLVRALRRRREIAVRLALGISRSRLVGQLLAESIVLAILGGAAALLVAHWGGELLRSILFAEVEWADSPVDRRLLAFTAVIALGTGVLAGLVPALQASRPDLTTALKSGAREGGVHLSRTRAVLVVAQASLAVVLLVGTGLFVRSLRNVQAIDLGVDADRVLFGSMDLRKIGLSATSVDAVFRRILERVSAHPGVESAAMSLTVPFWSSYGIPARLPGRETLPRPEGGGPYYNAVGPGFFETTGTRILRGRDFTDADSRGSEPVVIINETMARLWWPTGDALGQCIQIGVQPAGCHRVIAVVENQSRQEVIEDDLLFFYYALAQAPAELTARQLVVRPIGDPSRMVEPIRQAMQTAMPGLPYAQVRPLSTLFATELRPWRLGASMLGAFGALALVIAAVGLYSVISFSVAQRTHEMGVRIALGARPVDVVRLVVRQGIIIAAVGAVLGIAAALVGGRFVEPLLFETSAREPVMFGIALGLILGVAAAASVVPALRATRVSPVVALRTD